MKSFGKLLAADTHCHYLACPCLSTTWSADFYSWHTLSSWALTSGLDPQSVLSRSLWPDGGFTVIWPPFHISLLTGYWRWIRTRNPIQGVLSGGEELQTRIVCGKLLWNAYSWASHPWASGTPESPGIPHSLFPGQLTPSELGPVLLRYMAMVPETRGVFSIPASSEGEGLRCEAGLQ